jgi:hypothetical protein
VWVLAIFLIQTHTKRTRIDPIPLQRFKHDCFFRSNAKALREDSGVCNSDHEEVSQIAEADRNAHLLIILRLSDSDEISPIFPSPEYGMLLNLTVTHKRLPVHSDIYLDSEKIVFQHTASVIVLCDLQMSRFEYIYLVLEVRTTTVLALHALIHRPCFQLC